MINLRMVARAVVTALLMLVSLSVMAFANPYPATLDDGNLVLVDGGMGVGKYADRSSLAVEMYAPPTYQIAIFVYPVTFSEDYWQQHGTYVGSSYQIEQPFLLRFRYHWDKKTVEHEYSGRWLEWDINIDYSHADGEPLIPYTAEVAFASAYNMRFWDNKTVYSPVLKRERRIIDESLYRALGI